VEGATKHFRRVIKGIPINEFWRKELMLERGRPRNRRTGRLRFLPVVFENRGVEKKFEGASEAKTPT